MITADREALVKIRVYENTCDVLATAPLPPLSIQISSFRETCTLGTANELVSPLSLILCPRLSLASGREAGDDLVGKHLLHRHEARVTCQHPRDARLMWQPTYSPRAREAKTGT